MRTFHSYEDMAASVALPELCPVVEAFSGTDIVRWYNTIKFKLREMVNKQEANRNQEYADLLRTYANTWEANPIGGSMNREVLALLKAAGEPYSKMDWNQQSFFVGLMTSLDELLADQEQLPTGVDTEQNMPMAGGAGGSMPPMGTDFGPGQEAPPGEEGMPGAEGGPEPAAGEQGAPGAEPGQPGGAPQAGGPPPPPPGPGERPRRPTRPTA